jgi:thiosulfate reductase cytochrome b subunit
MNRKRLLLLTLPILIGAATIAGVAYARRSPLPAAQPSPIHPQFALLDANGINVLESGGPVSTTRTCGECHDAEYINSHSFHADLGLSDFGAKNLAHAWDLSNGPFGKWNPLTYRYLSPTGDERLDLGTSDWIRTFATRFVGGGPGVESRDGSPLPSGDPNPEGWDWATSGTLEMDCFLCHLPQPDNNARVEAIETGEFKWANTASLLGTELVTTAGDTYVWNRAAFTAEGLIANVAIQDPTNANCAQCHGVVQTDKTALAVAGCGLADWQTATTGQVISGEKVSLSGMNLADKDELTRSWDIHAERGLECTDCHYALNNPAYAQAEQSPSHLEFDPRKLEIGEYLQRPDHNLARGQSAQDTMAPELRGTMRRCEGCHDASDSHNWLPYAQQHMDELACESCHTPRLYAPAVESYDWTVLKADAQPVSLCRGVEGQSGTLSDLVTGFTPVLLSRETIDGKTKLAPYNLITTWYWVYDEADGPRPVREADLKAAYFDGSTYAAEIVRALDSNGDGQISRPELVLDTKEKAQVIADRLSALGLANPRIEGEIQPYSINHDVAGSGWATRDCQTCHSDDSRLTQPVTLATGLPGGVLPSFVSDANTRASGSLDVTEAGLIYTPATRDQKLYVFGHSRVPWVDWVGGLLFLGVLAAVVGHGGLRFFSALKSRRTAPRTERVYMYEIYERFWHWLQSFAIVLLLITGLIIHRPDMFGQFAFPYVVTIHNVLAILLVINASLSLFYHLVSGQIRQYLPRPYGFFDEAIEQAKYYLRGIFRGEAHPFAKVPGRKLNPLQQVTYFAILNVLLPLQIITGALMMGVQVFPQVASWFGGLPFLAPFHSLVAWTFAAFIVGHVYLTTTGPRALTSIQAMVNGWEEVEAHEGHTAGSPLPAKETL